MSVTSAATADRSERSSVTCANSGCPLSASIDGGHSIVAADAQVVALSDVVGEHDARALADPAEHREQHVALERLRLVDDDEGVVERAPANVGQREHLEHAARHDLLDHLLRDHRPKRVEDRLGPRVHLLRLGAGQVPEVLAAHGVQRPEHHDLLVLAALHHRLEPRAQRERALARSRSAAHRDDADGLVEKQVERDALLGGAAVQAEHLEVSAHQPHRPSVRHASERRASRRVNDQARVNGQRGEVLAASSAAGRAMRARRPTARTSARRSAGSRACRSSRTRPQAPHGTPRRPCRAPTP